VSLGIPLLSIDTNTHDLERDLWKQMTFYRFHREEVKRLGQSTERAQELLAMQTSIDKILVRLLAVRKIVFYIVGLF
jgi:hypothetical protein